MPVNYLEKDFELKIVDCQPYGQNAHGYGRKIATRYMIKPSGSKRWHRVYISQWSNAGTPWIVMNKEELVVKSGEIDYKKSLLVKSA